MVSASLAIEIYIYMLVFGLSESSKYSSIKEMMICEFVFAVN